MKIIIREYQDSDKELLKTTIESLMDYVVSTDPIKRIRRMPGYGDVELERTLEKIKKNKGKIYFAESDSKVVGYASCFITTQSKDNLLEVIPTKLGQLEDLYVEKQYRKKGIGKLLINKVEEYLRKQGCDSIWVEVFASNNKAYEYYKKSEFIDREIGMLKRLT